jgi:predicted AAA+ superfamily ATPase
METLIRDMEGNDKNTVSQPTVLSYLNALQRLFVIEDLEAWNPSIRSKTPLRSSSKRHFVDPSIACAALGINELKLLQDFNTFGYLFESMCIRYLRVYADYLDGKVYHYRDKSNLECDAIVALRDGRWGAIEIKMGAKEFDIAAKNLLRLKEKIDIDKMQPPSFLMILTATNIGYTRDDGIIVVQVGSLKW